MLHVILIHRCYPFPYVRWLMYCSQQWNTLLNNKARRLKGLDFPVCWLLQYICIIFQYWFSFYSMMCTTQKKSLLTMSSYRQHDWCINSFSLILSNTSFPETWNNTVNTDSNNNTPETRSQAYISPLCKYCAHKCNQTGHQTHSVGTASRVQYHLLLYILSPFTTVSFG